MHTNRLAREKSPYLLQHAHNPVDWFPWGEEAFEKARSEDKPIFLSIGYSTCHWCHVMERESFESEEIAAVLNRSFVPVKLDREERPDIDRIYMMFVQATTGGGGWPMSVFLTPELKPFFGGTYFPPDNRYGRPGFKTILEHLAGAWVTDRARIVRSAANVTESLRQYAAVEGGGLIVNAKEIRETLYLNLRRSFDRKLGGFGNAPKFPRPVVLNFLFREYALSKNEEALEMALVTLREMAKGGMNDQLGGGFHRYSVDPQWFVPHFEKMLYDQAQLAVSYLEAFQITGDARYAQVARGIFEYVLRDMTHPDGGFYSAEDADSVIDPARPKHKGEGAFYVWSWKELQDLLGEDAGLLAYRYGAGPEGNVQEDPHHEFPGKNILYEARSIEECARRFEVADAEARLQRAKEVLLEARGRRIRPHLDDKVLTAWNALMISALAKGGFVLNEPRYLEAARRAASFLQQRLMTAEGILLRRWRDGDAAVPGFLDDYAFFTRALVDLFETAWDPTHLRLARKLAQDMLRLFEDRANGGFYSTVEGDDRVLLRLKDDYDGAEPSGNSLAVSALLKLAELTGEDHFREAAMRTLRAFTQRLSGQAITVPQMVVALLEATEKSRQVVLAGGNPGTLLEALRTRFAPFQTLLVAQSAEGLHPALAAMMETSRPTAYVCEDYACQLPLHTAEDLARLLN